MSRKDTPTSGEDAQLKITRTYDRNSRIYDVYNAPMELMGGRKRRRRVLSRAHGKVLEVGVGTGRNLAIYTPDTDVTGIDISGGMLRRARHRAKKKDIPVRLERADVAHLPFSDDVFDAVTATCVFCSVADPVLSLREVARVVRPDGKVLLLEHVRPRNRLLGLIADKLSLITRRLIGSEINRRTEDNVAAAGLEIVDLRSKGIWREIDARPTRTA